LLTATRTYDQAIDRPLGCTRDGLEEGVGNVFGEFTQIGCLTHVATITANDIEIATEE
jgi:hypothetical protein